MSANNNKNTISPAVPQLPVAPVNYDQNQQLQLNNVLRLYFAALSNAANINGNNIASNSVLTWLNL